MNYKLGEITGTIINHLPHGQVQVDYAGTILTLPENDNELMGNSFKAGGQLEQIGGLFSAFKEDELPVAKRNKGIDLKDYGEKIGGAKKDIWRRLENITGDDIQTQPLSKSFPEPDYKKLMEEGVITQDGAILLKFLYNNIPDKPRKSYRIKYWVIEVQGVIDMFKQLVEAAKNQDAEFTDRIIKQMSLTDYQMNVNYSLFYQMMKGLDFPSNPIKLGKYKIKKFEAGFWKKITGEIVNYKERYTIVKDRAIIKDYPTLDEAIDGLRLLLDMDKGKTKSTDTKFSVYQDTKTKKYFIGKKGALAVIRLMEGFDKGQDAFDFIQQNQAQLQALWDGMHMIPDERRDENRNRIGKDWRNGEDITTEKFAKTFGFRGVEFGNWVNNTERQSNINEAYDALMDLAAAIGVPPGSLSLSGQLALAFGARGSGKANAHYERDKVVINLTKTRGAGSLAHEWWHSLDNYFSRLRGMKDDYITEKPYQRYNTRYSDKGAMDESVRVEMIDAYKGVMDAINKSKLPQRSMVLDRARSKPYWSTPVEMSARAFEGFVIDKLRDKDERNDYLANFKEMREWIRDTNGDIDALRNYPYPLDDETEDIDRAYQQFFDALKVKQNAAGMEEVYAKGGTILTAPNGQPSNLTAAQWATVRTPAFKAWFGDWENVGFIDMLFSLPTVNLKKTIRRLGWREENNLIKSMPKKEVNLGIANSVHLTKRFYEHTMRHAHRNEVFYALLDIEKICRNAILFDKEINEDKKDFAVDYFETYFTTIEFNSIIRIIRLTVRVSKEKGVGRRNLYDMNVDENEEAKNVVETRPANRANFSLPHNKDRKINDIYNTFSENISKVLDTNGEPKVVYHGVRYGTKERFNIFKTESNGDSFIGSYFTDKKQVAVDYANAGHLSANCNFNSKKCDSIDLYKCFLNIREIYILDADFKTYDAMITPIHREVVSVEEKTTANRGIIIKNLIDAPHGEYDNYPASNVFVVFSPNQIKLADGSNTTFDKNNPDIRYEDGGRVTTVSTWSYDEQSGNISYTIGNYEQKVIDATIRKAKKLDKRAFEIYWQLLMEQMWKRGRQDDDYTSVRVVESYFKDMLPKNELFASSNIQSAIKGDYGKRMLIQTPDITVKCMNDEVVGKVDAKGLKILQLLVAFTEQKYPGKKLEIGIGSQPVSIAGRDGFRMTPPDVDAPIDDMFPYWRGVIPAYKKMEAAGADRRMLWAAHDYLHELGHTLGSVDERDTDKFAVRNMRMFILFLSQRAKKSAAPLFEQGGDLDNLEEKMKNFDFSTLFSDANEKQKEQEDKDNDDKHEKQIASQIQDILQKIDEEIAADELQIKDWSSRNYKKNNSIVYAGDDDIHGQAFNVGSINEYRRRKKITGYEHDIESLMKAKEIIGAYDTTREGLLHDNLIEKSRNEDYIRKGKRMTMHQQTILEDAYDKLITMAKETAPATFEQGGDITERRVPKDLDCDLGVHFGKKTKDGYIIVGHGTSSNLLPSIYKNGLVSGSDKVWDNTSNNKLFFEIEPTYTHYGQNVYAWKSVQKHGGVEVVLYVRVKKDLLHTDRDDADLGLGYRKNQKECTCNIPPEDIIGIRVFGGIEIKRADFLEFHEMFADETFEQGGEVTKWDKAASASSRFRPYETIVFEKPIIGPNGVQLVSYTWAYEWTQLPSKRTGEYVDKRISDWTQAETSAATGRDIVHQFTILKPNGDFEAVSSESVPIELGYLDAKQMKNLPQLATAVKTLAKQRMQLAVLEAQQKEYDDLYKKFEAAEKPPIEEVTNIQQFPFAYRHFPDIDDIGQTFYKMGDVMRSQHNIMNYGSDGPKFKKKNYVENETREQLTYSWISERVKEAGGSRPYGLYDLKKRVARQEKKVEQITGGNVTITKNEYR